MCARVCTCARACTCGCVGVWGRGREVLLVTLAKDSLQVVMRITHKELMQLRNSSFTVADKLTSQRGLPRAMLRAGGATDFMTVSGS